MQEKLENKLNLVQFWYIRLVHFFNHEPLLAVVHDLTQEQNERIVSTWVNGRVRRVYYL